MRDLALLACFDSGSREDAGGCVLGFGFLGAVLDSVLAQSWEERAQTLASEPGISHTSTPALTVRISLAAPNTISDASRYASRPAATVTIPVADWRRRS